MFRLFQILGSEWPALTSASFADSSSDCSNTGTLPVLLQQPDSIATPCFPIQPRLASPPITGLQWNFLGVHWAATRRRHPRRRRMLKIVACCATARQPPLLRVRTGMVIMILRRSRQRKEIPVILCFKRSAVIEET
jgi:hypothetical protein